MKRIRQNVYAIDAMRAIAILAVVMIHTTSRTLEFFHYDLNSFPFALFLNQFSRFAVPLFFLISGFVLELNNRPTETYWQYIKKRVNRIFVPYVFWSALYYFLIYKSDSDNFIKALLTGSASYQLYFIPSLMIFYLMFLLLHKLYKYISNKWMLILLGVVQLAILYKEYYLKNIVLPFPIAVALFNFYAFFLGMIASQNYEKLLRYFEKLKYLLLAGTVTWCAYLFWQGRSMYYQTWNIDAFYSSWRPSVLIYTLVFGALTFYFFEKTGFAKKFFQAAAKLSFFVFFAHVLILEEAWKYASFRWSDWMDIPFFLAVSAITFLGAYFVHKIPHISKITG